MRHVLPIVTFSSLFASLYAADSLAYGYEYESPSMMGSLLALSGAQVGSCILAALVGAAVGAFLSDRFRKFRRVLMLIALGLFCVGSLLLPAVGQLVAFAIGFVVAFCLLSDKQKSKLRRMLDRFRPFDQTVFGSSTWASLEHLKEHGVTGDSGLFLGMYRHREEDGTMRDVPLHYDGDRHLMTVAAAHGIAGLNQDTHVLDPWRVTGFQSSCFNVLDWLDPNDPEIGENCAILWSSIVIDGDSKEQFWHEEARALGMGITLHVATSASERHNRTLARVRDIIVAGPEEFADVMTAMMNMRRNEALVLVENLNPIKAFKVKWFEHPLFQSFGINLETRKDKKSRT